MACCTERFWMPTGGRSFKNGRAFSTRVRFTRLKPHSFKRISLRATSEIPKLCLILEDPLGNRGCLAGNAGFFRGLVAGSVCAARICLSVEVTPRSADGSADEGLRCCGSQHFRSKHPLMPQRRMATRRPSNARQPGKGWLKRWPAALPPMRPLTGASGMAPARLWELTHRGSTPRFWSG